MIRRLNLLIIVVFLLFLTVGALASTKLKVNKNYLIVSSPKEDHTVIVSGKPRCVLGTHPIKVTVYNRTGETSREGVVQENGSFSVSIPGYGQDKLKITFTAANGKKKTVKRKVPPPPMIPW